MSKFLILWEGVPGTAPADPKERAAMLGKLLEMTKQALEKGQIKDWGLFAGGGSGYSIMEGTEAEVLRTAMQFQPSIACKAHAVLNVTQVIEVMKSMTA
ncbi:MAG: hypothetical protein A2Y92_05640 [Chloroflexi bacterium RBG_13_57_8]|nr:MAG: hypothetical protein A2Y92_05640 [Chloroflexi bacterium RBG_13_57_8]